MFVLRRTKSSDVASASRAVVFTSSENSRVPDFTAWELEDADFAAGTDVPRVVNHAHGSQLIVTKGHPQRQVDTDGDNESTCCSLTVFTLGDDTLVLDAFGRAIRF